MKGGRFTNYVVLGSSLLGVVLLGLAYRRYTRPPPPAALPLPAAPDLSRWPREMQDRVAAATLAARDPGKATDALSELARLYFFNGYNAEATQALQTLCSADSANGHWPYLLGLMEERAGNREQALARFESAARLAPDYVPALIHHANLLAILGQSDAARRIFEQCLPLAPQDPRVPFGLAKLDFARRDERSAIQRLFQIVQQFPKYQEAHLMLADLLAKAGDAAHEAEQRAFLAGGQASPPDFDPYADEIAEFCYDSQRLILLGEMRRQAEDYAGALPYMQRAARLEPMDPDSQDALARSYRDLQRWPEAQQTLELALKRIGPNDSLYVSLADVLLAQNKGTEALALLLTGRGDRPHTAAVMNEAGMVLTALGRQPEAIEAFAEAVRLEPLFVEPQVKLARAYLLTGEAGQARTWAERALKLRPESLEGLSVLTAACTLLKDMDSAVAGARELVRRGGHASEYRTLYTATLLQAGNLAAESGEHGKAEQLYREGLQADANHGQLHGALGMLCGKLHRYAEARSEFETFLRLEPRNPVGYILLGAAFRADNQPDEANKAWRTGLELAAAAHNDSQVAQLHRLLGK